MPLVHRDDKVWFDEVTKLNQLCFEISDFQANGQSVLLLSHFDATLERLGFLLRGKGIEHDQFSSFNAAELCQSSPGKVWLGSTRAFQVLNPIAPLTIGMPLQVVVAEHHPIHSRDQQLLDAAARLSCEAEVCFHFSLDDPVMKHFGAETVRMLFERLGIQKDECISHHLVTTAIRSAQLKIESQVGKDVPTYSAEDWLKYNLPETKEY